MFNRQVSIWNVAAPQYALTNLIDSDNFSIKREIELLKSTELFSSFVITDKKQIISKFGNDPLGASISVGLLQWRFKSKINDYTHLHEKKY
jgi:hypothetical protein